MYKFLGDTLVQKKHFENAKNIDLPIEKQRVLVVYNEPLTDAISLMIENMMKACKLQEPDYLIVNIKKYPFQWKNIATQVELIKEVILFGDLEDAMNLNFNFKINYPTMFDQRVWIKAHPLNEIYQNDKVKGAFWSQALQPYFT